MPLDITVEPHLFNSRLSVPSIIRYDTQKFLKQVILIVEHMIHCWLFNKVNLSKNSRQTCLIASRQGLNTIKTCCQINLTSAAIRVITFFLTLSFNICKTEHFIYKSGCGISVY